MERRRRASLGNSLVLVKKRRNQRLSASLVISSNPGHTALEQDVNGDLTYTFTRAWSDGTTGIKLSPLELLEKLAAWVPPPRVHQVRYGGCLAAHSKLRSAITPTSRQQGIESVASPASSRFGWARLLKRVFIDMERCPRCHQGALRLIAAITEPPVIRRILTHLKLAADPPPIAPARLAQEQFAWASD